MRAKSLFLPNEFIIRIHCVYKTCFICDSFVPNESENQTKLDLKAGNPALGTEIETLFAAYRKANPLEHFCAHLAKALFYGISSREKSN